MTKNLKDPRLIVELVKEYDGLKWLIEQSRNDSMRDPNSIKIPVLSMAGSSGLSEDTRVAIWQKARQMFIQICQNHFDAVKLQLKALGYEADVPADG